MRSLVVGSRARSGLDYLQRAGGILDVNQGSLYPALRRMKRRAWVRSRWRVTHNNRRARYYTLTAAGRRQLGEEEEVWSLASAGVDRLLETT
jgi:DNA-binding PadR family transcriptional regulator